MKPGRVGWLLAMVVAGAGGLVALRVLGTTTPTRAPASRDVAAPPPPALPAGVSALGRLEPEDRVIRIAGPSAPSVVIARLLVDDGDHVAAGQRLAELDTLPVLRAQVQQLEAELDNARRELARRERLRGDEVLSDAQYEEAELRARVVEAKLAAAKAEVDRAVVVSPTDGQVLKVHAREGERVGAEGILELGRTAHMMAVAEVYEDDIARVHKGQRATVKSPALSRTLGGVVDRVGLLVAKQDVIGTDPAAHKDARVIEVEVRLDDAAAAAALTNLQVEVEIEP